MESTVYVSKIELMEGNQPRYHDEMSCSTTNASHRMEWAERHALDEGLEPCANCIAASADEREAVLDPANPEGGKAGGRSDSRMELEDAGGSGVTLDLEFTTSPHLYLAAAISFGLAMLTDVPVIRLLAIATALGLLVRPKSVED